MTPLEIDRRLALAIGYAPEVVRNAHGGVQVWNDDSRIDGPMQYHGWQRFDHTDPAVIWPIAERFKAFPRLSLLHNCDWFAFASPDGNGKHHENPATASALAVITYVEGAK